MNSSMFISPRMYAYSSVIAAVVAVCQAGGICMHNKSILFHLITDIGIDLKENGHFQNIFLEWGYSTLKEKLDNHFLMVRLQQHVQSKIQIGFSVVTQLKVFKRESIAEIILYDTVNLPFYRPFIQKEEKRLPFSLSRIKIFLVKSDDATVEETASGMNQSVMIGKCEGENVKFYARTSRKESEYTQVAEWSSDTGLLGSLTLPEQKDQLRVHVCNDPPFSIVSPVNKTADGYLVDLWKTLAKHLNISYSLSLSNKTKRGRQICFEVEQELYATYSKVCYKTRFFSDCLEEIDKTEPEVALLAYSDDALLERYHYIPIGFHARVSVYTRKEPASLLSSMLSFYNTFGFTVLSIFAIICIIILKLGGIGAVDGIFSMATIFFAQGGLNRLYRSSSMLALIAILISTTTFIYLFVATLISNRIVREELKPDLSFLRSTERVPSSIVFLSFSAVSDFAEARSGEYSNMRQIAGGGWEYRPTTIDAFTAILTEGNYFICERERVSGFLEDYWRNITETSYQSVIPLSFLIKRDLIPIETISKIMIKLKECGILKRIFLKYWRDLKNPEKGFDPSLPDFHYIYTVYATGVCISIAVFYIEKLYHKMRQ